MSSGRRAAGLVAKALRKSMLAAFTISDLVGDVAWFGAGALIAGMFVAVFRRNRPKPYFAHAEYWVYLPTEDMPEQDKIMDRMMMSNPHRVAGKFPITKNEALIFSDVRLHIALVLRARNAHVFRPDLFDEHVEPTAELLEGLSDSSSFAKLRFISEDPLPDHRHLLFLAHAADSVADLGQGNVIYDVVAERLYTAQEFSSAIDRVEDAAHVDFQTQVVWSKSNAGGVAETRGLIKVGLPELTTEPMNADQRVLVTAILEQVIRQVWEINALPSAVDVSYFDDSYRVEIKPRRKGPAHISLMKLA
jgi:hypothetical protein